ncbi:hypothetical protein SAMN04515669_6221 [Jiangella sp. DSM 45060]|nr:hypothetical protein SAMN04515669_6221 [Jiangella sp. DSM 45060]
MRQIPPPGGPRAVRFRLSFRLIRARSDPSIAQAGASHRLQVGRFRTQENCWSRAWKACWEQSLRGSNPLSSANAAGRTHRPVPTGTGPVVAAHEPVQQAALLSSGRVVLASQRSPGLSNEFEGRVPTPKVLRGNQVTGQLDHGQLEPSLGRLGQHGVRTLDEIAQVGHGIRRQLVGQFTRNVGHRFGRDEQLTPPTLRQHVAKWNHKGAVAIGVGEATCARDLNLDGFTAGSDVRGCTRMPRRKARDRRSHGDDVGPPSRGIQSPPTCRPGSPAQGLHRVAEASYDGSPARDDWHAEDVATVSNTDARSAATRVKRVGARDDVPNSAFLVCHVTPGGG